MWLASLRDGSFPMNASSSASGRSRSQLPSADTGDTDETGQGGRGDVMRILRTRYLTPGDCSASSSAPALAPSSAADNNETLRARDLGTSADPVGTEMDILPMSAVQLKSLRFRAGVRYLYAHMNQCCEHYMYFSDIRVFHPIVDTPHTYPRLTYMAKFDRRKCEVCFLWSAQYITYGDRLALNNPTHFCQHCYHMLHYRTDGTLLYDDFNVFPYLHHMR
jgi:hypothetical protein